MNVEISEKQYDGIYKCYKGNEIKTNIALYNSALISSAEQSEGALPVWHWATWWAA